ncbi:MAG: Gfo/Idh/MocA family oxidoreductase [Clostridiales bacterium]|jgi:predicted dehydrogenase|nr:Gfo/Idh/MocA family oxidoreductase [Clostridiales bacterium]
MKKKIGFAVVGVGRMGSVHALNLYKGRVKGAELAAVADISEDALASFAKKAAGVARFSDYEEMAARVDFDAVIIAVPHYFHTGIARFFLERGKYTLIEKPVAVTLKQAEEFNEYLKLHGEKDGKKLAAIGYNQRTNNVYKKAKELIDGGAIGGIKRANFIVTDWYRSDAYYKNNAWRASYSGEGGGILINQCVHQLDILQLLTGMPVSVSAEIATVGREITAENDVTAVFRYANGAKCLVSASGHELDGANRIEIAGERGRLTLGKYSMRAVLFDKPESAVNAETAHGYGKVKKRVRRYFYGAKIISDALFGQQLRTVKNLAAHISKGEELIAPAEEGIFALTLINAVYLSAFKGVEVALPLDADEYERALQERIDAERAAVKTPNND